MDIGAELRQARELRGLSLHDLSARTKISVPALRAIENNEMHRLPAGIFTRGFLSAYAREVGLDPADILDHYVAQFEAPAAEVVPAPDRMTADDESEFGRTLGPVIAFGSGHPRIVGAIAVLALVAAGYFVFGRSQRSPSLEEARSQRPGEAVVATDGSSPPAAAPFRTETGTAGSIDTARAAATASGIALRLDLEPTRRCWVFARADGLTVVYRLMEAGDRQTIEARHELVLRVGDPANLAFSINGAAGRPLGRPGEPVTVRITPGNYAQFLRQ